MNSEQVIQMAMRLFIAENSEPEPNSGCWLWTRAITSTGYGHTGQGLAHRISYCAWKGHIPEAYDIDHLCRTKLCVNPDHLEAVTRSENLRRGQGFKVSDTQAETIRLLYASGKYSTRQLAALTGVSKSHIHLLIHLPEGAIRHRG